MNFHNTITGNQVRLANEQFTAMVDDAVATDNRQWIVRVHDGRFHLDDAMAVAIVRMVCAQHNIQTPVVRTRNDELPSVFTLDVGGVYDPAQFKFDHHQAGFEHRWMSVDDESVEFPMAACGLVWGHFGRRLAVNPEVFFAIEEWLVQVDSFDTGHPEVLGKTEATTLAGVIGMLQAEDIYSAEQDECFAQAVVLCMRLLSNKIRDLEKLYAFENHVLDALEDSKDGILELEEGGDWKSVASRHWEEFQEKGVKVCLFFGGKNTEWRVQTMAASPENPMSMACPAPKSIRGLRDSDLEDVTGIKDAAFVHPAGFLGGGFTYEAARSLAEYWVANA